MDAADTSSTRLFSDWQALSEAVAQELTTWRAEHPQATLAEIETVVWEAGQRLQAHALQQLAQASPSADRARQPADERPTCPQCGGRLGLRGRRRRQVRPGRQRAPLELERTYAICPACDLGLFPPGPGTGPAAE